MRVAIPVAAAGTVAVAAVLLVGVLAAGGIARADHDGSGESANGARLIEDPAVGPRQVTGRSYAEYLGAQRALGPLPHGMLWPVGVPPQFGYGSVGGGLLRPGSGSDTAHFTWLCAWESDMLASHRTNDVQRVAIAGERIRRFFDSDWARGVSRDGIWVAAVYLPTRYGNYAGMQVDVRQTCRRAGLSSGAEH